MSLGLFMLLSVQGYAINIDARTVHTEYNWCWTSSARMAELWGERKGREKVLNAGAVVSCIGVGW